MKNYGRSSEGERILKQNTPYGLSDFVTLFHPFHNISMGDSLET